MREKIEETQGREKENEEESESKSKKYHTGEQHIKFYIKN
jgi:hypothetical protein